MELDLASLPTLTVVQLRGLCIERGLPATPDLRKQILIKSLTAWAEAQEVETEEAPEEEEKEQDANSNHSGEGRHQTPSEEEEERSSLDTVTRGRPKASGRKRVLSGGENPSIRERELEAQLAYIALEAEKLALEKKKWAYKEKRDGSSDKEAEVKQILIKSLTAWAEAQEVETEEAPEEEEKEQDANSNHSGEGRHQTPSEEEEERSSLDTVTRGRPKASGRKRVLSGGENPSIRERELEAQLAYIALEAEKLALEKKKWAYKEKRDGSSDKEAEVKQILIKSLTAWAEAQEVETEEAPEEEEKEQDANSNHSGEGRHQTPSEEEEERSSLDTVTRGRPKASGRKRVLSGGENPSIRERELEAQLAYIALEAEKLALEKKKWAYKEKRDGSSDKEAEVSMGGGVCPRLPKGVVPAYVEGDDIDKWLGAFERALQMRRVKPQYWGSLL
ncbi:hypothetical protein NDU88_002620 [Pleurodeles waltl]|uniref:SAP domain-containing protein n=1 Tax=Pleurodeles waltl TaxID=8319 RepID=A0AAV7VD40_PLEWA|nr:hypothetical protein NDU88_002620 [Pleurodeles waltl]